MKEIQLRIDLTELENILRKAGRIKDNEHLNDGHIEPNELVLRVLCEDRDTETEQTHVVIPRTDKKLVCPACGESVSRVHYTEHGTKVLSENSFGTVWEDDLNSGDCYFYCPECDCELEVEELVEAGII